MIAIEIYKLRKEGHFTKAYTAATELLEKHPGNAEILQALGWVLYDFLKQQGDKGTVEGVQKVMDKIVAIAQPCFENFYFERVVAVCSYFLYKQRVERKEINFPKNIAFSVLKLPYERPSAVHSTWLETILNFKTDALAFLEFAKAWGPESFSETDFVKRTNKAGQPYVSLAESYVLFLAKAWLSVNASKSQFNAPPFSFQAHEIIDLIDSVSSKVRANPFFDYYKSQLFLIDGKADKAKQSFAVVVAQKPNDSWVWGTLAGFYNDKPDWQLPLLCKALHCPGPGEMKVKLHQQLAQVLSDKALFAEANHELEKAIGIREKNNWPIPAALLKVQTEIKLADIDMYSGEKDYYKKHSHQAFSIAFSALPSKEAVLTELFRDDKKTVVSYVVNREESGRFRQQAWMPKAGAGQTCRLFLSPTKPGQVLYWEPVQISLPESIVRQVSGTVKTVAGKNFTFVEDVFVPPALSALLTKADSTKARILAVCSFDKFKKKWGWRAIKIIGADV